MKKAALMISGLYGILTMSFLPKINQVKEPMENLYEIEINGIDGQAIDLNSLKGKKILFVNVASKCGFTPQYEGLQELHEQYGEKLTIIGLPCNQFGKQEPGTKDEIVSFCQKNYGVTFQITEKIEVKGSEQHPLYQWLTKKEKNGAEDSSVKWNFQKYLVDEEGRLIDIFSSKVKPLDEKIVKHL